MHPHESLIREFYAAFASRDAEAMARCYHDDVFFSDPVFPKLHGEEARDISNYGVVNTKKEDEIAQKYKERINIKIPVCYSR